MKERPILFNGEMVRAILEGRKTQTRRPVNKGVIAFYGLTGDRIQCIHTDDEAIERCYTEAYSNFPKHGLHGGGRWGDLLTNQVCRIWAEGVRGLVSVERSQNSKGVQVRFTVSREHKGYSACSQAGLHGFSRDATQSQNASSASGWKSEQQHAVEPEVGHSGRELDGQKGAWKRKQRGEASRLKVVRRTEIEHSLSRLNGVVQPKNGCAPPWDVPVINLADSPLQVGTRLWVRETWSLKDSGHEDSPNVVYRADHDCGRMVWTPSIHMPRWASRIDLEITRVWVERVQDITEEDAKAEGVIPDDYEGYEHPDNPTLSCAAHRYSFRDLWQSIYGTWRANPWVWAYEFRRIKP